MLLLAGVGVSQCHPQPTIAGPDRFLEAPIPPEQAPDVNIGGKVLTAAPSERVTIRV